MAVYVLSIAGAFVSLPHLSTINTLELCGSQGNDMVKEKRSIFN